MQNPHLKSLLVRWITMCCCRLEMVKNTLRHVWHLNLATLLASTLLSSTLSSLTLPTSLLPSLLLFNGDKGGEEKGDLDRNIVLKIWKHWINLLVKVKLTLNNFSCSKGFFQFYINFSIIIIINYTEYKCSIYYVNCKRLKL